MYIWLIIALGAFVVWLLRRRRAPALLRLPEPTPTHLPIPSSFCPAEATGGVSGQWRRVVIPVATAHNAQVLKQGSMIYNHIDICAIATRSHTQPKMQIAPYIVRRGVDTLCAFGSSGHSFGYCCSGNKIHTLGCVLPFNGAAGTACMRKS